LGTSKVRAELRDDVKERKAKTNKPWDKRGESLVNGKKKRGSLRVERS